MELVFNQINDRWEAEIKVTADFNLHIEGVREGNVSVFMRGTESGEYAYVRGATPYPSVGTVYEYDFSAVIFPKYIKVACATAPSLAVVTSAGEVIQIEKPVEPDTPSEPEVIEYHFEIPMEEDGFFIEPAYYGTLEGDFSKEYSAIVALSEKIGVFKNGFYTITEGGSPLTNPKITVNGFNVTEIRSAPSYERIEFSTDAPYNGSSSGDGTITKTSIGFSSAEPHAPSSDLIEYHFEFNNLEEEEVPGMGMIYGQSIFGDYTEPFNRILSFTKDKGTENGGLWEYGEYGGEPLTDIVVTANGYKAVWINAAEDSIQIVTNGPQDAVETNLYITPTYVMYESPTNQKAPSSDIIEYHFEVPMGSLGYVTEGEIEGDFSNIYNKIATFAKEKGKFYGDDPRYVIEGDPMSKMNITVNEDTVTYIEYYVNMEQISLYTDGPDAWGDSATAKLYKTSVSYIRGK